MHRRSNLSENTKHPPASSGNSISSQPRAKRRTRRDILQAVLLVVIIIPTCLLWPLYSAAQSQVGDGNIPVSLSARSQTSEIILATNAGEKTAERTSKDTQEEDYHIVFSTSCSSLQDWQSYLFFYQAFQVKQRGNITRILSGCSEVDEKLGRETEKHIQETMSNRFHYHFTPDFGRDGIKSGREWQSHKYFNKPFGVRHWLENVLGYPHSPSHQDTIVVLVDPDMLLLRPFRNNFSDYNPDGLWAPYPSERIELQVTHGHPIAQRFGFGSKWMNTNLTYVVGNNSRVHGMSYGDAGTFYPAGPPYILTVEDMYTIASRWTEFATKSYEVKQQFMAEMYGYSLAAAHTGLEHQLARGFMVSDLTINGEGWTAIDQLPLEDACKPLPVAKRPLVLHYCQRYSIGDFFFSKYKLPRTMFSCEKPMMKEPPTNAAVLYNFSHYGDGHIEVWKDKKMIIRNAFMVCNLLSSLNEALAFYKKHHCGEDANYTKVFAFFEKDK